MAPALVRIGLLTLAVIAAAWLVWSFRAVELESEGNDVIERVQEGRDAPDVVSRGLTDLRRARRFNADQSPTLVEIELLTQTGRGQEGIALAKQVVAEEPDNLDGWIYLYLSSFKPFPPDPERAARALRMVRALNPLAVDALRSRVGLE